jgi:curved DNA-binding protein CbpA
VDEAALERRYKLLQWTLHPDKSVSRTPQEQGFSAEHASHVNQAYGVLRKPLSRANYLVRALAPSLWPFLGGGAHVSSEVTYQMLWRLVVSPVRLAYLRVLRSYGSL